jgi:hypothetical protein
MENKKHVIETKFNRANANYLSIIFLNEFLYIRRKIDASLLQGVGKT